MFACLSIASASASRFAKSSAAFVVLSVAGMGESADAASLGSARDSGDGSFLGWRLSKSACKSVMLLTTLLTTSEICGVVGRCGGCSGIGSASEGLDEELEESCEALSTTGSGLPTGVREQAATES